MRAAVSVQVVRGSGRRKHGRPTASVLQITGRISFSPATSHTSIRTISTSSTTTSRYTYAMLPLYISSAWGWLMHWRYRLFRERRTPYISLKFDVICIACTIFPVGKGVYFVQQHKIPSVLWHGCMVGVRKSTRSVKIEWWGIDYGYLSEARCRLFAYGPAYVTASKPHHLSPHLNPDWFYLSGTGLPRLSWKRGR